MDDVLSTRLNVKHQSATGSKRVPRVLDDDNKKARVVGRVR